MTRQEMIMSFVNAPGVCKQQCPYQGQCHHGDFCIFKEAALVISADAHKIEELKQQQQTLRELTQIMINYASFLEKRCYDYYDDIYKYNGGVTKKLWIPPSKRMAMRRRKKTLKAKREAAKLNPPKDVGLMDGNPLYAEVIEQNPQPPEVII